MGNPNKNCVPGVCFVETVDNSACKPNPCKNGGTCYGCPHLNDEQIYVPSYVCTCVAGWDGDKCES